jgi:membrane protein required for colicin V production
MDGFTLIDAIVAVVILISALLAYSRGFAREAMSILGWIAAAIFAFMFAPQIEPLVTEIPVAGDYLARSCELSIIASFFLVFAASLLLVSLFTPVFSSLIQRSFLSAFDSMLGFLFGALRGILLVAVAFVLYDRVMVSSAFPMVDNSRSAEVFNKLGGNLGDEIPDQVPGWITLRYEELVGTCGPQGTTETTSQ